jgi:hypothetical protein
VLTVLKSYFMFISSFFLPKSLKRRKEKGGKQGKETQGKEGKNRAPGGLAVEVCCAERLVISSNPLHRLHRRASD